VTSVLAGSRSPRHVQENAEAAQLDLTSVLDEIETLIPLGPAFTPEA
jgi:aryl-alcohol dehydrogenase-like predicted oxidoreductase